MKKLLISLMTVAIVAAGGIYATRAYFSDTEKSSGNFIQAGTVDISVDGENPWETAAPWTIEDIKPSTTHYMKFTINNVGENDADVWKRIPEATYSGGLHPESELEEDPDDTINDIGRVIHYDMYVNTEPLIQESDGYYVDGVLGYWIYLGRLTPGESMVVEQSYHMDSETTNWAQGDIMTFNVELYAQQVLGGATAPQGELPDYGRDDLIGNQGVLDEVNIGDTTSEADHNLVSWSDPIVWSSGYGGGDNGTFRLLMGRGDTCVGSESATFTLDAGTNSATKLTLTHLDGSQDDSFDVYVNSVKIGHYEWDGNTAEQWKTTTFNLSTPVSGTVNVELVATDPVGSWCATWGQVAFSLAKLEY